MTHWDDLRSDLPGDAEPGDAAELQHLAERLEAERPVPAAVFRGNLRRRLLGAGAPRRPPAHLHVLIAAAGGSGAVLLLVTAASVAGFGPLAA
jgi:hypothetical protein